jgi:RNA polymerase sigma-70 factor, ECF subfamily
VRSSRDKERERTHFESEIVSHLDHLYRVAYYLLKDGEEAQDCVQETFARALGSRDQFTAGSNMKAWLTKILYNFFYDFYRRRRRVVSTQDFSGSTADKQDFWETLAIENPGPEAQALNRELGRKIEAALKKIPDEFSAPIILVDVGELTYAEAAAILSCPIGTVRSRLSRGRKLLQGMLGSYVRRPGSES